MLNTSHQNKFYTPDVAQESVVINGEHYYSIAKQNGGSSPNLRANAPVFHPSVGPSGKPRLTGEEYLQLKRNLRERTNRIRHQSNFRLREKGLNANIETTTLERRTPLLLSDIQHLIMYSQLGHFSPYTPARWCALERFNRLAHTSVLIFDNVSMADFGENLYNMPFLQNNYSSKLEMYTPSVYNGDVVRDLSMVPLTVSQVRRFTNSYGGLDKAVECTNTVFDAVKNLFPIAKRPEKPLLNGTLPPNDSYPRTQLLLNGWQMIEENFPMPIRGLRERKYPNYRFTKEVYEPVTPLSKMFGIDCEMCTTLNGESELTRVSIVDEQMNVVYDTLVKPRNKITDYLTPYSGITKELLKGVTVRIEDVQRDLRRLLPPDAIFVGQSLNNDLHALKMMHPYIIDTSVIYNLSGERGNKTKLKILAEKFIHMKIQEGTKGHCSTEDSIACLKLVQHKLAISLEYGDATMGWVWDNLKKSPNQYNNVTPVSYATSLLDQCTKEGKRATVVGMGEIGERYMYYANKKRLQECVKNVSADGSELVPSGPVDLMMDNGGRVRCHCTRDGDETITSLCRLMAGENLSIGHVFQCGENGSGGECAHGDGDAHKWRYQKIDQWCSAVFEKLPTCGLSIVLFTGRGKENGMCFIQLKRDNQFCD